MRVPERTHIPYELLLLTTGMLLPAAWLGYGVQQHEFWKIIAGYVPMFATYWWAMRMAEQGMVGLRHLLILAVLTRLLMVFGMPALSNDVFRFLWDGRLLVQGYNPFDHLPEYYLENDLGLQGIDRALFEAFDAKNTFSVYPPLAQLQFASAVWLFPGSEYAATVVMKGWLFAYELGTILLLPLLMRCFGLSPNRSLIYALNPLIIVEVTGNVHFEGAMVFFLLLAMWLWVAQRRLLWTAVAFGGAICSKLLPLMFLPFLVKPLGWRRSLRFFLVVGVVATLLFLPVLNAHFLGNFADSLNLYFQKLEYNASLYYALRWLGYLLSGYNQIAFIGPALGVLAGVLIAWFAWRQRVPAESTAAAALRMMSYWLLAITIYLFCTTTLHPWYLVLPIVLCGFTKWRYPVMWSGLIFLTYINYSYSPYRENLWVVAFEYTVLLLYLATELRSEEKISALLRAIILHRK